MPDRSWASLPVFPLRAGSLDAGLPKSPPAGVVVLGVALDVAALTQLVIDPERPAVQVLEVGVPILLTAGVFFSAYQVARSDRPGDLQRRILFLSALFMVIATATVLLVGVTQGEGSFPADLPFAVVVTTTVGASVGAPIGIYYDEAIAKRDALAVEVARTRALNQRLQVVNRVLRHNVRNRLAVALGSLDVALHRTDDEEIAALLRTSREAVDDLHDHTEKTLRLEGLPTGGTGTAVLDLVPVIEEYLTEIRRQYPDVEIRADLPERARARVHPLVDAAIVEVIENAVEHNDPSDLTVDVGVRKAGDQVVVEVTDTGYGLPMAEHRVLDGIETPLEHASGIGLWFIKWATEASSGELEFEPNEPTGTIVRLRLPLAPA